MGDSIGTGYITKGGSSGGILYGEFSSILWSCSSGGFSYGKVSDNLVEIPLGEGGVLG